MTYNIHIPIEIGLFTLATACLIIYFVWLVGYIKLHQHGKKMLAYVLLHMFIMIGGLLLTGFAKDL